jgi:uncharacterized protein
VARRKYSLLAIDGGGIRGIIPARVLQAIEARLGRPISELFDLVAGTSTGGIIALGLSRPSVGGRGPAYSAADLVELYVDHGHEIFPHSPLRKIRTLWGLIDVRYPAKPLEDLLRARFEDVAVSNALIDIVIPTYDLSGPAPFFFKRSYTREDPEFDVEMWRVARATSAAPTYFEPARVVAFGGEHDHALVDGGVFANDPAVCAYAEAIDKGWGQGAKIYVVSIGTGQPPQEPHHGPIPVSYRDARHWGLVRWARPMLEVVFDGVAKTVEYEMARLCREHETLSYFRLQSSLPTAHHAMDDGSPDNVARLLADAETLLETQRNDVDEVCAILESVADDRTGPRSSGP